MASLHEIREERLRKLALLKAKGMDAFPLSARPDATLAAAAKEFAKLSKKKGGIALAGRVMALRGQGAILFFDLYDGTGKFQGLVKKDELPEEAMSLFADTVDIGDFIEVRGTLFLTKRKEKTILAKEWRMLAKSLRPLPDKWHGLSDVEERFRRRYLDLLMSAEVKERFVVRSSVIAFFREYLNAEGYLEVETPILQELAGGALAEPFRTHHHALDMDLYLRIAPELYLKELLVGGFTKVYELSRNFRNEGVDATHNPEFTMLEYYEAYGTAAGQRAFVEKMLRALVKKLFKKTSIEYGGEKIDFAAPFAVVPYFDLLRRHALIPHPEKASRAELANKAAQLAVDVKEGDSAEKILDNIYKKAVRPKLVEPTFIVDYPVAFSPFAKAKEGNPAFIDRFQLVVGGLELVNAFSELNDPEEQRVRYGREEKKRKGGEKDISPSDESYLEAMEYGMPPAAGLGLGVDRLTMLLTDVRNIKEVILFPTMRPRKGE
ncbi:MAG: lysine--tRNA ligase [bacterium]|nr:lysine--tRNA ligase [bacterium]